MKTIRGSFEISVDDKGHWHWTCLLTGRHERLQNSYSYDLQSACQAAENMGGILADRVDSIEDAWRMSGDLPPRQAQEERL